ncbi:hypothetical protein D0Y65_038775 [Glycine soja]|uniref:Tf2-1-like SH3-like domain-containing protein n=1 Tax=Glycine soja TaxID=3848 RepID=A0A445H6E6_GLYSO|nr:hypothetical protein D0Y65_038775 [Glycine soja]
MRTAQSRQKSYHDKRRKDLEFEVGDHVFLRVTPWTGVGRALKSRKLTPRFIGPFQILKTVGPVAYQIALPPSLSNLHNVFHVSQLRKYIYDPSHVVELDDIQVKENLTYETLPLRIEDRRMKHLRGKEIPLVKVIWGGTSREGATWELESQMQAAYPSLFESERNPQNPTRRFDRENPSILHFKVALRKSKPRRFRNTSETFPWRILRRFSAVLRSFFGLQPRRSCPVARRDKLWSFYALPPRLDHPRGHTETNYGHSTPCVNQKERTRQYQDDVGRSVLIIFKIFAGSAGGEIHRPNGVSLERN